MQSCEQLSVIVGNDPREELFSVLEEPLQCQLGIWRELDLETKTELILGQTFKQLGPWTYSYDKIECSGMNEHDYRDSAGSIT